MIAKLTGKVDTEPLNYVIVEVSNIGYKVFVTGQTRNSLIKSAKETSFWIHHALRENSSDLYGFLNQKDLDFFELLLTISGIGPKSALAILNSTNAETLEEGIRSGDASYLSKVSGIGKKTAEKIILGLKDKIGTDNLSSIEAHGKTTAIDALVSLGYNERDARDVVQKIDGALSTESIVKEALKSLGK